LSRAHEEAEQLFELAARKDRQLAVALAHRLSSSLEAMRLVIEASAASSSRERGRASPSGRRLH
jgi:predicted dehydrogenase